MNEYFVSKNNNTMFNDDYHRDFLTKAKDMIRMILWMIWSQKVVNSIF